MREDDLIRLKAMHDATRRALSYAEGKSRSDLETDLTLLLFTKKALEIIATAATKTTKECKKRYGDFPWKSVVEFGKRPARHKALGQTELDRMWIIVTAELPRLSELLESMVSRENADQAQSVGG